MRPDRQAVFSQHPSCLLVVFGQDHTLGAGPGLQLSQLTLEGWYPVGTDVLAHQIGRCSHVELVAHP